MLLSNCLQLSVVSVLACGATLVVACRRSRLATVANFSQEELAAPKNYPLHCTCQHVTLNIVNVVEWRRGSFKCWWSPAAWKSRFQGSNATAHDPNSTQKVIPSIHLAKAHSQSARFFTSVGCCWCLIGNSSVASDRFVGLPARCFACSPLVMLRLQLAGNGNGTSLNNQGANSNWWSSTANTATNARNMNVNSSATNPANNNNKYNGFSVRCLLAMARVMLNVLYLFFSSIPAIQCGWTTNFGYQPGKVVYAD